MCVRGAVSNACVTLLLDRDAKSSQPFRALLKREGTDIIRLPPRSPNLIAYAERFVRSIKAECIEKMIFVGGASLRHALREFMCHYHAERNHQGLENCLLAPCNVISFHDIPICRRDRLGGQLRYYYRKAA